METDPVSEMCFYVRNQDSNWSPRSTDWD